MGPDAASRAQGHVEKKKPGRRQHDRYGVRRPRIARMNGRVIVCETGIGTKLDEKQWRVWRQEQPEGLLHSAAARGDHA